MADRPQYSEGSYQFGMPSCIGRGCGYWNGTPLTKVTVLQLDGTTPRVARESWFEGSYVSSRRVGSKVRAVLSGSIHGPSLRYWPDWSSRYQGGYQNYVAPTADEQIAALEGLRAEREGHRGHADQRLAALRLRPRGPGHHGAPGPVLRLQGPGQRHHAVRLHADRGDGPGHAGGSAGHHHLGAVDTVYSNASTMILASRGWMRSSWYWGDDAFDGTSVSFTHLHAFDLGADPSVPTYEGSATVPGTLVDQFSVDVRGDVLRVATTEQRVKTQWYSNGLFGGHAYRTRRRPATSSR